MPQNKPRLDGAQPIVEKNGTMTQTMRTHQLIVSNNIAIVASGSPEGVIEATQYTVYVDETIPTAPVTYRKMIPRIGGDVTKGWIIV